MVLSQTNVSSNVGQSNVTSGSNSYVVTKPSGEKVLRTGSDASRDRPITESEARQREREASSNIIKTNVTRSSGESGVNVLNKTTGEASSVTFAKAQAVNQASNSSDVPHYEGASFESLATGTNLQTPSGLMPSGYETSTQSVFIPKASQTEILQQAQSSIGRGQAQRIQEQQQAAKETSFSSLATGASVTTPSIQNIQRVGDMGYTDTLKQQSVQAKGITPQQIQRIEQERLAPTIQKQLEQQNKSLYQKGTEYLSKENKVISEKLFPVVIQGKRQVDPFGLGYKYEKFISEKIFKQPYTPKLREEPNTFGSQLTEGMRKEITENPIGVGISAGFGATFKAGEVLVGEALPTVITGSKLFKGAGYVAGAGLLGYQEVVYAKDISQTSFGEATGKLLVDVGAFSVGYGSTQFGINKIGDVIRTRGLEEVSAEKFFSKQTVEGTTIKQGLAKSPSFEITIKQFKKGIQGEEGFVSTGSPKPLEGVKVVGGEKAGIEDLGLYVSPKGEAQPLFTRVQGGQEIPKEYSFNIFANIGASKPTLTNIYGIEQVKFYPQEVLRQPGFQAVAEYSQSQIGKGYIFPTKRSMIGQGIIKRQIFEVPFDVNTGKINWKAGQIKPEAGTSEAEAIIAVGEQFGKRPTKSYVTLEGRRIVIEERNLLKSSKINKSKEIKTTKEVKDIIEKQQEELSRLSSKNEPKSSLSFSSNLSESVSGKSFESNISNISSLSKVSGLSRTSSISNISNISNLSNLSNKSFTSRVSQLSNLSSTSEGSRLSSLSGTSKSYGISNIQKPYEINKYKLPSLLSGKGKESYVVTVGKKGKTKLFKEKTFGSAYEAEQFLKGELKGTLAASGTIKTSSGQSVMVNLGEEFTPSKREAGRIVQKAKYRLSSSGEKAQIRGFRI